MVDAMLAVVSAGGRMTPSRLELDSIAAIQRHMLGMAQPLTGLVPGPLPADLPAALPTDDLRRHTVRFLALLPMIDRRILPGKVRVVEDAAARLAIQEPGLDILRHSARGRKYRVAFALMQRFVSAFWSPTGKARLRDYAQFVWWMLPRLHGERTARRNRALTDRFNTLAQLPDGTLGREVHRFHSDNGIPMPGEPSSVPWSLHEVYHVVGEYGIAFHPELLLTAFIGGNQDETCLDQLLFGLLAHHVGMQIIGGHVTQGLLEPDAYFRAMARGAAMRQNLLKGWTLWDDAATPLPAFREKFHLPPFAPAELETLADGNELLAGPGYTLPAPRPAAPRASGADILDQGAVARIWTDAALRQRLAREPAEALRMIGVPLPAGVQVTTVTSRSNPSDREPNLYQFVFETADRLAYAYLPAPGAPKAQQTAYGDILADRGDDPALETRFRADLQAALGSVTDAAATRVPIARSVVDAMPAA